MPQSGQETKKICTLGLGNSTRGRGGDRMVQIRYVCVGTYSVHLNGETCVHPVQCVGVWHVCSVVCLDSMYML